MDGNPAYNLPFVTRAQFDDPMSMQFSLLINEITTSISTLQITGATRSGPFNFTHVCAGSQTNGSEEFKIPDIPIWISVQNVLVTNVEGNTYVNVSLKVNGDIMANLISGFVYARQGISWPNPTIQTPHFINSSILKVTSSVPGAGGTPTNSFTTNIKGFLRSVTMSLTTSATVANRRVRLQLKTGTNIFFDIPCPTVQTASTTLGYVATQVSYGGQLTANNMNIIPLPADMGIFNGGVLQVTCDNIDATDQFTAMIMFIEYYPQM